MSKFLALNISISQDGFIAGPDQSLDNPLGIGGPALHKWVYPTKAFSEFIGKDGGTTGLDNDLVARGFDNIGANIMGRNMFGPVRGEWGASDWIGWWGDTPKFEHPVYILTHHERDPIDMGNGTIFYFVTEGIERACELALAAAAGGDIRVGGGANTLQQFLAAGILDELHLAHTDVVLGSGEKLFTDSATQLAHYESASKIQSGDILHETFLKI